MQRLVINKDVEMPVPRVVFSYPYEDMEVGDSFAVSVEYRNKVMNANYRANRRLGFKFTCKTVGEELIVWRVA